MRWMQQNDVRDGGIQADGRSMIKFDADKSYAAR